MKEEERRGGVVRDRGGEGREREQKRKRVKTILNDSMKWRRDGEVCYLMEASCSMTQGYTAVSTCTLLPQLMVLSIGLLGV